MAHLISVENGIERAWQNAVAAKRRAAFCNACEIIVHFGWIKKASKLKMKTSNTRNESKTGAKGADDRADQGSRIGGIHRVHMKSKIPQLHFALLMILDDWL
ncbi:hypothetical protein V6N13_000829 [Hibiscus sabdariffa]|uniref:Uncharacterized protein n=1 Tax=Hibiscus sabdariffa TaxID=183260 RepID=A0ABR2G6U5_9ROSI